MMVETAPMLELEQTENQKKKQIVIENVPWNPDFSLIFRTNFCFPLED